MGDQEDEFDYLFPFPVFFLFFWPPRVILYCAKKSKMAAFKEANALLTKPFLRPSCMLPPEKPSGWGKVSSCLASVIFQSHAFESGKLILGFHVYQAPCHSSYPLH